MKTKHGQYIELFWDDHPQFHAVRGHVTEADGRLALAAFGLDADAAREPSHEYARWSMDENRPEGTTALLKLYGERGAGRFPVTVYRPLEKV